MSAAHILLIEDEDFAAELIQTILVEQGYEVTVVGDAESAWETLKDGAAVELILLDRRLPGMDGLTLLKRIKADADLRHVPVVMQTGLDAEEHIREGLAAGAYYYLTKPPQSVLLLAVIRAALVQQRETALLQDALSETVHALEFLQSGTFSFRTITEARSLAQSLAKLCPDPRRAVLGLQELMINAVEHGNYGISYASKSKLMADDLWHDEIARLAHDPVCSQRHVTVHLSRTPDQFSLTIQDEGAGFEWEEYLDFSPARAFDLHGRGIAMSRLSSFDFLEYQGIGNTVTVRIEMPSRDGAGSDGSYS